MDAVAVQQYIADPNLLRNSVLHEMAGKEVVATYAASDFSLQYREPYQKQLQQAAATGTAGRDAAAQGRSQAQAGRNGGKQNQQHQQDQHQKQQQLIRAQFSNINRPTHIYMWLGDRRDGNAIMLALADHFFNFASKLPRCPAIPAIWWQACLSLVVMTAAHPCMVNQCV
jgi:hypothetical protein